mmetsp:Transcript_2751/g.7673  ORF Transcript_2751/g.7673 Transcript_2751/m.7673 type:complete len:270 (-) Transcript_2751:2262-3071(-)
MMVSLRHDSHCDNDSSFPRPTMQEKSVLTAQFRTSALLSAAIRANRDSGSSTVLSVPLLSAIFHSSPMLVKDVFTSCLERANEKQQSSSADLVSSVSSIASRKSSTMSLRQRKAAKLLSFHSAEARLVLLIDAIASMSEIQTDPTKRCPALSTMECIANKALAATRWSPSMSMQEHNGAKRSFCDIVGLSPPSFSVVAAWTIKYWFWRGSSYFIWLGPNGPSGMTKESARCDRLIMARLSKAKCRSSWLLDATRHSCVEITGPILSYRY